MNFFQQGIPLGRWFRITVVIHWTFLIYAGMELFGGDNRNDLGFRALFMFLLFGTVLLHEFGHALSCRAVGGEAFHIVLWPLGGIAFVQPQMNPMAWLITTICGPLVNAILWPVFYYVYNYGLPYLAANHPSLLNEYVFHGVYAMWQINKALLLFNLIPAYPMDGGRLLQEILWFIIGYRRSLLVAGMVGTVAGICLVVIGTGIHPIKFPFADFTLGERPNSMLAIIGLLAAMQSFALYRRAQEIQGWQKN